MPEKLWEQNFHHKKILVLFVKIFLQKDEKLELCFLDLPPLDQVQHVRTEEQEQGEQDILFRSLE